MITVRPFQPVGASKNIAVTTGVASTQIPMTPRGTASVRLTNTSAGVVFIGFGVTAAEAEAAATTAGGMPMLGSTVETFQFRQKVLFIAVRGAEATGALYITYGESV